MPPIASPEALEARLVRGRAAALARMTSTCEIRRRGPLGPPDPETGHRRATWEVIYSGPTRVADVSQGGAMTAREAGPGGVNQEAKRTASYPHGTDGIRDGDIHQQLTGELAGTWWVITESTGSDQRTALRLPVAQIDRPEDWEV